MSSLESLLYFGFLATFVDLPLRLNLTESELVEYQSPLKMFLRIKDAGKLILQISFHFQ